jgi:hypothetical protein
MVKLKLEKETRILVEKSGKGAFCRRFYSTCTANTLSRKVLKVFGGLKIGGQILGTVKYADYFVMLAEEKTVLQGVIVRLIEIGRCCGVEINVAKILR